MCIRTIIHRCEQKHTDECARWEVNRRPAERDEEGYHQNIRLFYPPPQPSFKYRPHWGPEGADRQMHEMHTNSQKKKWLLQSNRKLVFINERSGSSYRAELICMLRVLLGISVNYCQPLCVCSYVTVGGNYIKCEYLRGWPFIYNICKLRPMFLLYTYVKTCWTCIFFCVFFQQAEISLGHMARLKHV